MLLPRLARPAPWSKRLADTSGTHEADHQGKILSALFLAVGFISADIFVINVSFRLCIFAKRVGVSPMLQLNMSLQFLLVLKTTIVTTKAFLFHSGFNLS